MRRAYTLVEIMITLSLLVVLMGMVAFSLDSFMRALDVSKTEVEEAQLSRAILDKISREIRSTVIAAREENLEVDEESLSTAIGLGSATGALDAETASSASESLSSESVEMPEAGTVLGKLPGIYGGTDWIQIDVGKLPRGESFGSQQVTAEGTSLWDRLSPVKTVLYYLGENTGELGPDDINPLELTNSLGQLKDQLGGKYGLFRRQLDRLATEYATENGTDQDMEQYDEPLAPEIEDIEFQYYDGDEEEWIDYWDMDEKEKLPVAVQVTLVVRRKDTGKPLSNRVTGTDYNGIETVTYSKTVMVPITFTKTIETEETTEEGTESESGTGSQTGEGETGGGGTGGGGTGGGGTGGGGTGGGGTGGGGPGGGGAGGGGPGGGGTGGGGPGGGGTGGGGTGGGGTGGGGPGGGGTGGGRPGGGGGGPGGGGTGGGFGGGGTGGGGGGNFGGGGTGGGGNFGGGGGGGRGGR